MHNARTREPPPRACASASFKEAGYDPKTAPIDTLAWTGPAPLAQEAEALRRTRARHEAPGRRRFTMRARSL